MEGNMAMDQDLIPEKRFAALIEDYKVRSEDVRMRSSQYERLWLFLITTLGGLFTWSFQVNLNSGKELFFPNIFYPVMVFLTLIWEIFLIYVLNSNRFLTLYLLKLEEEIRTFIKVSCDDPAPMQWKTRFQQMTQDSGRTMPTSWFGVLYVILGFILLSIFLSALYQTYKYLYLILDMKETASTIVFGLFGLFLAIVALNFAIFNKVIKAAEKGKLRQIS
jgi:hypothetical protein